MAASKPFIVIEHNEGFDLPFHGPAWYAKIISPATLTLNDLTNLSPAICEEHDTTSQMGFLKTPIDITYNGVKYQHPVGTLVRMDAIRRGENYATPVNAPVRIGAAAAPPAGGRRTYRKRGRKNQQRRQNRKSQKSRK